MTTEQNPHRQIKDNMQDNLIISYGGGVNSTALLVGLKQRNIIPKAILFSDTGGEKPDTYAYLDIIDKWLDSVRFPKLIRLKYQAKSEKFASLEEQCLNNKTLPSIAYGFKTCSQLHKAAPQDKWLKANMRGIEYIRVFGFDAGEGRRAIPKNEQMKSNWYPLIEWGWFRIDCIKHIAESGLPIPPKSSCFFCPAMKKSEIYQLQESHPLLFARAVAMEENAKATNTSIKGLGRNYAWGDLPKYDENIQQLDLFEMPINNCDCFDGGGTDALYLG